MVKWKEIRRKKAEEKKKQMEENLAKESNNFRPKINKNSSLIVLKSAKSEMRLPIYDREVPGEKRFKSKIDEECTFKPKINKRKVKWYLRSSTFFNSVF